MSSESELVRFGGLSVAQYAGITAAIAEGHAPADALAQESLEADAWSETESQWREAIVESLELQVAYTQRRREAEDHLTRSVSPLDDDPAAWAGLLGAIMIAPSLTEVLEPLGLCMNDVNRLSRAWRRKQQEDEALGTRLAELAATAKPPTSVVAGPKVLRPFPWSKRWTDDAPEACSAGRGSVPTAPVVAMASFQRVATLDASSAPRHLPSWEDATLAPAADAPLSLPFGRRASEGTPPPTSPPAPQSGETIAALPHIDAARELPFEASALALTSVERYAALVASLRATPERADELLCAAGLRTVDQRRRVHQLWATRFQANPALRETFERALKS